MTTNIKAVVFDYGNVLIEWNPRYVYERYFPNDPEGMEEFLKEINFMDWNALQDRGRPFAEGVAELSEQFPHHAHLIEAYHEHWIDSIGEIYWSTVDIIHELKQKSYGIYGLSNWSAETFPRIRDKYSFFELFDDMVISGEVGHVKPHPEIFEILLKKIGRPAQECLFIDDSLPNIQQADRMGFVTIHFQDPKQLKEALQRLQLL